MIKDDFLPGNGNDNSDQDSSNQDSSNQESIPDVSEDDLETFTKDNENELENK